MGHIVGCRKAPLELLLLSFIHPTNDRRRGFAQDANGSTNVVAIVRVVGHITKLICQVKFL